MTVLGYLADAANSGECGVPSAPRCLYEGALPARLCQALHAGSAADVAGACAYATGPLRPPPPFPPPCPWAGLPLDWERAVQEASLDQDAAAAIEDGKCLCS